jgi:hypothetical protein
MQTAEEAVSLYLKCPLTTPKIDLHEQMVFRVLSRVLLKAHDYIGTYSVSYLRDLLSKGWESYFGNVPDAEYFGGHRKNPGIAKRIGDLIRDYQFLGPLVSYDLVLDGFRITGEYAVARPWGKDLPWLCVSLRRSKPSRYYPYPDFVAYARWLHLQSREPGRDIQILHVPVLHGEAWIEKDVSLPLVRELLDEILALMRRTIQVPHAGPHCKSCVLPRCLEKTHGSRPDGHQAKR